MMTEPYVVTKTETADSGSVRTYITLTDDTTRLVVTTPRRQSTGPNIERAIEAAILNHRANPRPA